MSEKAQRTSVKDPTGVRIHNYKLAGRIVVYAFITGILGIIAYIVVISQNGTSNSRPSEPSALASPVASDVAAKPPGPMATNLDSATKGKFQTSNQSTPNASSFSQKPATPTATIKFVLSARVFDDVGDPISGAIVSLVDTPEHSVRTVANGAFVLNGISKSLNERTRIRVESRGYVTKEFDVVIGRALQNIRLEKEK